MLEVKQLQMNEAVTPEQFYSNVTISNLKPFKLYRSHSVRLKNSKFTSDEQQLNVFAKEFIMAERKTHSSSLDQFLYAERQSELFNNRYYEQHQQQAQQRQSNFPYRRSQLSYLQQNIFKNSAEETIKNHHLSRKLENVQQPYTLNTSASSNNIMFKSNRGKIGMGFETSNTKVLKSGKLTKSHSFVSMYGLKRSKSFSTFGSAAKAMDIFGVTEFKKFSIELQKLLMKAIDDPNTMDARALIELVRHIFYCVINNKFCADTAAKICMAVIEKENKETFFESLLNFCQQWYQERKRDLQNLLTIKNLTTFMTFLNEMYCQLKRRQLQLKTQQDKVQPDLAFLTLLWKCCHVSLHPLIIDSPTKASCLFYILTCIGKDLALEFPVQLHQLLAKVRDAFLNKDITTPIVRRTLLQLIELHAAHWQLSAPAVIYYYPG